MRSERLLLGVVVGPILNNGFSEVIAGGFTAGGEVYECGDFAYVWDIS